MPGRRSQQSSRGGIVISLAYLWSRRRLGRALSILCALLLAVAVSSFPIEASASVVGDHAGPPSVHVLRLHAGCGVSSGQREAPGSSAGPVVDVPRMVTAPPIRSDVVGDGTARLESFVSASRRLHTYYVMPTGTDGVAGTAVLVHNANSCGGLFRPAQERSNDGG